MTSERQNQIEQAIATYETHGLHWTNKALHAQVGGNYSALAQYLKHRRAGTGGTAVLDAPLPAASAAVCDTAAPPVPAPAPVSRIATLEAQAAQLVQRTTETQAQLHALKAQYDEALVTRREALWKEQHVEGRAALMKMRELEEAMRGLDDLLPALAAGQEETAAALDQARRDRTAQELAHWRRVAPRVAELATSPYDDMCLRWVMELRFGRAPWRSEDHRKPSMFERPAYWKRIEQAFPFLDDLESLDTLETEEVSV